ncbi:MAG: TRAP transporter small permease subunit [Hyphomonas sp.]|jgi:TRAP-type C4-dicarboxylate transport system permease small subunit
MAETLLTYLRRINRVVAGLVGLGLLACAGFVLADILARRLLGHGFGGTEEISGYTMAIATAWGMGYTLMELGHVRIDLIRNRTLRGVRALFDLFSMAVFAATVSLIAIRSWPVLERSLQNGSRANTPLETPLALVQTPWFAGWVWFAAVAWLTFLAGLLLVLRRDFDASERAIGAVSEVELESYK